MMGRIMYWEPFRAEEAFERYEKFRHAIPCTVPVLLFPKIERRSPAELRAVQKRLENQRDWTRPRHY